MKSKKAKDRSIGKRIHIAEHGDMTTIIIESTITSAQRLSLEMWFGAWTGLGTLFAYGAFTFEGDERLFYLGSLVFWAFFWVRIAKVVAWRRIGKEVIKISNGGLMMKNAFNTRGREWTYSLNKVGVVKFHDRDATSFIQQLDNSFWILGGDTLYFLYEGRTKVLGKQLTSQDSKQLANVLNKAISAHKG
jgi:hypothetical protein